MLEKMRWTAVDWQRRQKMGIVFSTAVEADQTIIITGFTIRRYSKSPF